MSKIARDPTDHELHAARLNALAGKLDKMVKWADEESDPRGGQGAKYAQFAKLLRAADHALLDAKYALESIHVCPDCGNTDLRHETATKADPDCGIAASPAGWYCECGCCVDSENPADEYDLRGGGQ